MLLSDDISCRVGSGWPKPDSEASKLISLRTSLTVRMA